MTFTRRSRLAPSQALEHQHEPALLLSLPPKPKPSGIAWIAPAPGKSRRP